MGANENIYLTISHKLFHLILFFITLESSQGFYSDRKVNESIFKGLMMLISKQCCWHQNCYLLPRLYCKKCCSHSNFGFTETNITANQSIHGLRRVHISENF